MNMNTPLGSKWSKKSGKGKKGAIAPVLSLRGTYAAWQGLQWAYTSACQWTVEERAKLGVKINEMLKELIVLKNKLTALLSQKWEEYKRLSKEQRLMRRIVKQVVIEIAPEPMSPAPIQKVVRPAFVGKLAKPPSKSKGL